MVITCIKMGLGNQLFQYAAGKSLAHKLSTHLKLDIQFYDEDVKRRFQLDCLQIKNLNTIDLSKINSEFHLYTEPYFHFDKKFYSLPDNIFITGFWQSERYFKGVKRDLRNEFKVKPSLIIHLNQQAKRMAQEESVSLHIRRGDYLYNNFLVLQPLQYYQQILSELTPIPNLKVYIFSDNIEFAKENLLIDFPHEFISTNITQTDIEDFFLMQNCKYHIIANSSFSWWAAWLSPRNGKKIFAPKVWFSKEFHDCKDLIPAKWLIR